MVLLVDADNSPGRNIQGINRLEPEDTVYIYFASNNKYYKNRDRQAEIIRCAKCKVIFNKVSAANNAVDFAIAIDLRALIESWPGEVIVLVSEDGHFKTIIERAKEAIGCHNLFLASSIEDANMRYKLLDSNSLQNLHKYLVGAFNLEKGGELYKRIDGLFEQKYRLNKDSDCFSSAKNKPIKTYLVIILEALVSPFRKGK